jgi:hypothetical protein
MATAAMGLTLPVVGVTPGATAGTNIVDNFNIIDVHDHSSGKGVQVPAAGLNINAALSFGNQKAFNLSFVQLVSQGASPVGANDRPNVHVLNGDLYYTNSSGTAVQITNAGSISGTSGSIGGLASPASAQFATNAFTWKATATDYAKFNLSEINIYPFTTSPSNALTLKVSNSVTAYTITLPDAAPASTQPLGMTSGGVIQALTYDSIGTNMTSTGANAIAASRTRATGTTVAAGGVAISASSGTFTTTSITNVDVTNLSVTITTSGRPVFIGLVPDNTAGNSFLNLRRNGATTGGSQGQFYLLRDGLTMFQHQLVIPQEALVSGSNDTTGFYIMPLAFGTVDVQSAGTYTYKMQVNLAAVTSQIRVNSCKLVAYEL